MPPATSPTRTLNPRLLSYMAYNDVSSNVCQARCPPRHPPHFEPWGVLSTTAWHDGRCQHAARRTARGAWRVAGPHQEADEVDAHLVDAAVQAGAHVRAEHARPLPGPHHPTPHRVTPGPHHPTANGSPHGHTTWVCAATPSAYTRHAVSCQGAEEEGAARAPVLRD